MQVHYKSWMNIHMNEFHGIGIHDIEKGDIPKHS
jgi:hypothetical protein